jgi:short-subunit dehydrogenase
MLFDFYSGDFTKLRADLASVDIGLVVNSVGVGRELLERYGDNPAADHQLLRVNALGAAEFLSCVLRPMEEHGGGQIVVLSSTQGIRPIALLAAYSAAKVCFIVCGK